MLLPSTLGEALAMLGDRPDAVPMAGGTDLLVHWPSNLEAHNRTYLDLSRLDELRPIRWTDDALELGALTTYWDTIRDSRVSGEFPLLVKAARQVGAVQIQARGTWAGNIVNASPAADGVPVLMAYDAVVALESVAGREEIPLDRFYTDYKRVQKRPDQLVVAVRVPRRPYDLQMFDKVGPRRAQSIAKVGVAATRSQAGWRVVASSVAPTVRRCSAIEAMLKARTAVAGPDGFGDALAQDVAPIDDVRSTAEYRRKVLARLLYFGLREECEWIT